MMNRRVKILLAKYIGYVEAAGYVLVAAFIAGLIALSTIKAEDETVELQGGYHIPFALAHSPAACLILDSPAGPESTVRRNDILLEVTQDPRLVSDRLLRTGLEAQARQARDAGHPQLADKLSSLAAELAGRSYPGLQKTIVRAPISGEFVAFKHKNEVAGPNEAAGGVFDFAAGRIRAAEWPSDKRLGKKLRAGQTATVTLKLAQDDLMTFHATLVELTPGGIIFRPREPEAADKVRIARHIATAAQGPDLAVNLSVLVGIKSWMSLIWQ